MADIEKLIKSLERCSVGGKCDGCHYHDACKGPTNAAMADAVKELREAEKRHKVLAKISLSIVAFMQDVDKIFKELKNDDGTV